MADTGYPRKLMRGQQYRAALPDRHATSGDWEVLEVHSVEPTIDQPWYAAVYASADVDAGTVGQLRMRSSAATDAVVAGTGSWTVDTAGLIRDPDGQVLRTGGMNGSAPLALGTFGDPTGYYRFYGEGLPNFSDVVDIWPGYPNGSPEQYPGGLVSPGRYFSSTLGDWVQLDDKVWALTGDVSTGAATFGIVSPRPDHWHCRLYRMNCHLVNGPETWNAAPTVTAATSIPQYVARVEELRLLGLVVVPEDHDMTASNPTLPAGLVATPTLASSSVPAGPIRNMLDFYDALCTAYPGGASNVWLGLPNEPYTTGPESADYVDFIVTMVRRIRAKGFGGIITLPLGHWCGDLAGLARGDYAALISALQGHGVAWSIGWELHNYGLRYTTAGSTANVPYTWATMEADLAAVRAAGHAVWMAEYGQALPAGTSAAGTSDRLGVDLIAGGDDPLAALYPELCPTWWSLADNTFVTAAGGWHSLTLGPGQTETMGTDRRFPWWDIDGSNLHQLTEGGRYHWDAAHMVSAGGLASTALAVSPPAVVRGYTRNLRLGFERLPTTPQLLYVEGRRVSGTGGLRLVRPSHAAMASAPPAELITSTTPPGGGGGGGGGGTVTAPSVRSTWQSSGQATSHTVTPSSFSPPAEPGDKVVFIAALAGTAEVPTVTLALPGTTLVPKTAGTGFNPQVQATVADYSASGWSLTGSFAFRVAAVCIRDAVAVLAGSASEGSSPLNPGGVAHADNALGLVVNVLNYTTASVLTPATSPGTHNVVLSTPIDIRQIHVASIDRATAATYDPGAATIGPGTEPSVAFALVAQPTAATLAPAAPVAPAWDPTGATTLNASDNIASIVAGAAPGAKFILQAVTYTNWNDVRPKTGMHFRIPNSGTVTLEGSPFVWACRAIDATGSSDNVIFSSGGGRMVVQNYGDDTARQEYGAFQAGPMNTGPGSSDYTYGVAQGWQLFNVDFVRNSSGGYRCSDYTVVSNCGFWGHTVSGVSYEMAVGGRFHNCDFDANGLNPASGVFSNGAGAKFTWSNGSGIRTAILSSAFRRAKSTLIFTSCSFAPTHSGVTGSGRIGLWLDLDCEDVEIWDTTIGSHADAGLIVEGCNGVMIDGGSIDNCDGYGNANGEDFIAGALTIGEAQNVLVRNLTISNSVRAIVIRQSGRADWNAPGGVVNYVTKGWITGAQTPRPLPGQQASQWTSDITIEDCTLTGCDRVILSEGTNAGGMAVAGSLPLSTFHFYSNDYSGSTNLINATSGGGFFTRSNTGATLTAWKAQALDRDQ